MGVLSDFCDTFKLMSSKGKRPQQRYGTVRSQLEKQTAALLAQRRTFEGSHDPRPENPSQVRLLLGEAAAGSQMFGGEDGEHRTEEVIGKLQEIIRLCKEENLSREEMQEVVKVERQVLSYLQRDHHENQARMLKPTHDTPQGEKQRVHGSPPANQTWGKPHSNNQNTVGRGEDTLEIIAELERKALSEIIHLQKQRDALKVERDQLAEELNRGQIQTPRPSLNLEGERLKEENRLLREENRALQLRIQALSGPTIHRPSAGQDFSQGLAAQQSHSQIAVYQNELKRAMVVINELRSRLANVAGLEGLHEQGERIRRETAELLHYKSRNMHGDDAGIITELQQRLEQEQRGKAQFFEELKLFKQKFAKLQQQNLELKHRLSHSQQYPEISPIERPSARGRQRGGFSDYESTLNQMRQLR